MCHLINSTVARRKSCHCLFPHSTVKGPESERTEDAQDGMAAFQPSPLIAARVMTIPFDCRAYCPVCLVLESMLS